LVVARLLYGLTLLPCGFPTTLPASSRLMPFLLTYPFFEHVALHWRGRHRQSRACNGFFSSPRATLFFSFSDVLALSRLGNQSHLCPFGPPCTIKLYFFQSVPLSGLLDLDPASTLRFLPSLTLAGPCRLLGQLSSSYVRTHSPFPSSFLPPGNTLNCFGSPPFFSPTRRSIAT